MSVKEPGPQDVSQGPNNVKNTLRAENPLRTFCVSRQLTPISLSNTGRIAGLTRLRALQGKLLSLPYPEYLRPTDWTGPLCSRLAILEGNLGRVLDLPLCPTLEAICFHRALQEI